jgi:methylaspartate mutase epsilon subunit
LDIGDVSENLKRHSILLGGVGGDSHSVGMTILRQALANHGYRVLYIGTQNGLDEFFELVPHVNAVMVSCMDGHARHYLTEFPQFHQQTGGDQLWYLGGNPSVEGGAGDERRYLEMGFARVFLGFVDLEHILAMLEEDLALHAVRNFETKWIKAWRDQRQPFLGSLPDQRQPRDAFDGEREGVLGHWKTGVAARNLVDNAEFLKRAPSFPALQAAVNDKLAPMLLQPRSGVATESEQIKLFETFKQVGARVLSYQVDSLTRNNNYAGAEEAIRESTAMQLSTINGFPAVNHGVAALRRIIKTVNEPLQMRHSTRDPRLLAEIACAGGVTAYEGGAICYNIPYYRDYALDESIRRWQYVDRLMGVYYDDFGIVIDREYFGTLTGTLVPPCIAISTGILESLLAIQQGVRCVSIGYAEQGCRPQDIAAIRVIKPLAKEIFARYGFYNIQTNSIFCQYMAAFPQLPHQANELIYQSAITAALAGATRVLTKTPVEAFKIPSMSDNIEGLALAMKGVADVADTTYDKDAVEAEAAIISREVNEIVNEVIELGRGNVADGIIHAFRQGIIDVPFAPSLYNAGEAITARDEDGAVRFANFGNLPFSREIKLFHSERMQARRKTEGLKPHQDHLLVERDVLRISRGQHGTWPLRPGVSSRPVSQIVADLNLGETA